MKSSAPLILALFLINTGFAQDTKTKAPTKFALTGTLFSNSMYAYSLGGTATLNEKHQFGFGGIMSPPSMNSWSKRYGFGGHIDYSFIIAKPHTRLQLFIPGYLVYFRDIDESSFPESVLSQVIHRSTHDELSLCIGFGVNFQATKHIGLTASLSNNIVSLTSSKNQYTNYLDHSEDYFNFDGSVQPLTPRDFLRGRNLVLRVGIQFYLGK